MYTKCIQEKFILLNIILHTVFGRESAAAAEILSLLFFWQLRQVLPGLFIFLPLPGSPGKGHSTPGFWPQLHLEDSYFFFQLNSCILFMLPDRTVNFDRRWPGRFFSGFSGSGVWDSHDEETSAEGPGGEEGLGRVEGAIPLSECEPSSDLSITQVRE